MTIYSEDGGGCQGMILYSEDQDGHQGTTCYSEDGGGCQGRTLYSGESLLTKSGNRVVVKERPFAQRSLKNAPKLRCGFVRFVFLRPHERAAGRGE